MNGDSESVAGQIVGDDVADPFPAAAGDEGDAGMGFRHSVNSSTSGGHVSSPRPE